MTKINKLLITLLLIFFCSFQVGKLSSKLVMVHKLGEFEKIIENLSTLDLKKYYPEEKIVILNANNINYYELKKIALNDSIESYCNLMDNLSVYKLNTAIKSDVVFIEVLRYKMEKVLINSEKKGIHHEIN